MQALFTKKVVGLVFALEPGDEGFSGELVLMQCEQDMLCFIVQFSQNWLVLNCFLGVGT